MAAYRRVYDSRHLQADCREPGSAPEPYARQSSMGYLYLFTVTVLTDDLLLVCRRQLAQSGKRGTMSKSQAAATVSPNPDGSVSVQYVPKQSGAHDLSVLYNDIPVAGKLQTVSAGYTWGEMASQSLWS